METQIITINKSDTASSIREKLFQAGKIIRQGGLVAFPTETVYGLGGDALNPDAAQKIYAAKGRPSDNPLIVHISQIDSLDSLVSAIPDKAKKLAKAFWPGPLTMIMNKSDIVPSQTTGGLDTVAVRMPSHPVALEFIKQAGGYVAAPSANLSGKPSPTTAKYVIQDMDGRVDMIIAADDSEEIIGLESTIVDMTSDIPAILRPGYITQAMISREIGATDIDVTIFDADSGKAPKAPGMKYRHYAPRGELVLVEGRPDDVVAYINAQVRFHKERGEKTGVIGTDTLVTKYDADIVKNAGSRDEPVMAASRLYTFLREFDDENVEFMYSESFKNEGLEQAIMNRLLKAAGHKIIKV